MQYKLKYSTSYLCYQNIERVLLIGVSPVAQDNLTSGVNFDTQARTLREWRFEI